MHRTETELLLAGAPPGGKAGNAVSTDVMLRALKAFAQVTLLSHHVGPPTWSQDGRAIRVGVQPLLIHSEAMLAGLLHRRRLRAWPLCWVVNSRYAGAPFASGVPYIVWEATTARDELGVSNLLDVRRSARGSGAGFALHRGLLPLGESVEGRVYRAAVRVLTMSAHTRDRILATHRLSPDKVHVQTHPPGPAYTCELAKVEARLPRATSRDLDPWRLLFVGRADDARKNFALLPEVLRRLATAGHHATLTVIGPHNAAWHRGLSLDGISDSLRFAGAVSLQTLAQAYLQHDLLLVPSRQEGFGIVVAEALAAGLPVIATKCGGPEQIIADSGAGELVSIDAASMADAVVRVMGNAARLARMRDHARRYAAGPLNFARFAGEVERITNGALQELD